MIVQNDHFSSFLQKHSNILDKIVICCNFMFGENVYN